MIDTNKIVAAAEQMFEGTDLFVVSCTCSVTDEVELLIDSDIAVSIDTCAELSRAIDEAFDREEEDFSLTVASAGIGTELKSVRQYRKLIGQSVEVLLLSGIKILAKLEAVTDTDITLSFEEKQVLEGKKRKQVVTVERQYPFTEIKYTKEYLDFK
ncbi:MAG: ribosome assembly cofactor RimP [Alistipes sp.]